MTPEQINSLFKMATNYDTDPGIKIIVLVALNALSDKIRDEDGKEEIQNKFGTYFFEVLEEKLK